MTDSRRRSGRSSSRDKLLDAAAGLVAKHGVQNLTIDAVAAEARVTKGGLIYHFKTRDDLLGALIERMVEQWDVRTRMQDAVRSGGTPVKDALSLLLDETFDMSEEQRTLLTNLLAAAAIYPHLLEPVKAYYARDFEAFNNAPNAGMVMILAAAIDGIALLEILGLHQFSAQQRQAMRDALEKAIGELP
mgnify:FL=1